MSQKITTNEIKHLDFESCPQVERILLELTEYIKSYVI